MIIPKSQQSHTRIHRVELNMLPGHPQRRTHQGLSNVPILFITILKDIFQCLSVDPSHVLIGNHPMTLAPIAPLTL